MHKLENRQNVCNCLALYCKWFLQTTEDYFPPHNNADPGKYYILFYTSEAKRIKIPQLGNGTAMTLKPHSLLPILIFPSQCLYR